MGSAGLAGPGSLWTDCLACCSGRAPRASQARRAQGLPGLLRRQAKLARRGRTIWRTVLVGASWPGLAGAARSGCLDNCARQARRSVGDGLHAALGPDCCASRSSGAPTRKAAAAASICFCPCLALHPSFLCLSHHSLSPPFSISGVWGIGG